MPGFTLALDSMTIAVAYLIATTATVIWLHCSTQTVVPANQATTWMVVTRLTAVAGVTFVGCYLVNIAVWVPLAAVAFLLLLAASGNILGFPGLLIGLLIQQYVLGFPIRRDLVLHPPLEPVGETRIRTQFDEHIGARAVTTTPLKPSGEIAIGDDKFNAVSEYGTYVDAGASVLVTAFRNGSFLVRELGSSLPPAAVTGNTSGLR